VKELVVVEGGLPSADDVLLDVRNLSVYHRTRGRTVEIVRAANIVVRAGEAVALIGESGSGKTLTARAIAGLLPRGLTAEGEIFYQGKNLLGLSGRQMRAIRGREISLVLQDPFTMLNPVMRSGRHIEESIELREPGISNEGRRAETRKRLAEVGITTPLTAAHYPFQLSGGQLQRIGIAAALAGEPRLLIADEPSTALDVRTQREILRLLKSVQKNHDMGLIFITHDLRVASAMCDRLYVLYAGSILETGPSTDVRAEPLHPYTVSLHLSEPPLDKRLDRMPRLEGRVPHPGNRPEGQCVFAPRCEWRIPACTQTAPPLRTIHEGRMAACIRLPEIETQLRGRERASEVAAPRAPTAIEDAFVEVRDVTKIFHGRDGDDVVALAGVSLTVGPGEAVGLFGESGSGKTTLGRCVVGLEHPTSGAIVVDGVDIGNLRRQSADERRRLRRTVQIVFQDPYSSLNPARTVGSALEEAVKLGGATRDRVEREARGLLDLVGLPAGYLGLKPAALSGGERQRVAIARTLALQPMLIVCDEPVSSLDVSVQAEILNLFSSLRDERGIGYLFITHDLAVARQVTDRGYVLHRGAVVEQGDTGSLLDQPAHAYTRELVGSIPQGNRDWIDSATSDFLVGGLAPRSAVQGWDSPTRLGMPRA
jgi:peptide/nickel transport system ATP-binding protein